MVAWRQENNDAALAAVILARHRNIAGSPPISARAFFKVARKENHIKHRSVGAMRRRRTFATRARRYAWLGSVLFARINGMRLSYAVIDLLRQYRRRSNGSTRIARLK